MTSWVDTTTVVWGRGALVSWLSHGLLVNNLTSVSISYCKLSNIFCLSVTSWVDTTAVVLGRGASLSCCNHGLLVRPAFSGAVRVFLTESAKVTFGVGDEKILPGADCNAVNDQNYRLITTNLLLRANFNKMMHTHWDFDAINAQFKPEG